MGLEGLRGKRRGGSWLGERASPLTLLFVGTSACPALTTSPTQHSPTPSSAVSCLLRTFQGHHPTNNITTTTPLHTTVPRLLLNFFFVFFYSVLYNIKGSGLFLSLVILHPSSFHPFSQGYLHTFVCSTSNALQTTSLYMFFFPTLPFT